jgi:hypothetical protein
VTDEEGDGDGLVQEEVGEGDGCFSLTCGPIRRVGRSDDSPPMLGLHVRAWNPSVGQFHDGRRPVTGFPFEKA